MQKTMIITGGSAGIGEATIKRFTKEGYLVFNLDNHPPTHPIANTHYIACDVSKPIQILSAVQEVLTHTDTIDTVVSCAGIFLSATIEETSEVDFDSIMSVNVKGSFFLLRSVLPTLKAQKKGNIILIASDQAFVGKPHSAAYGATKGALAQLAKSTAIDYAPFHIRVNAVCPGTIRTPLYEAAIHRYHETSGIPIEKIETEEAHLQPLNRIGLPHEVADLIFFLASDAASFITGGLFPIDGGYTAR